MSKIKLKRSLVLAALLGVGNNVTNATDYGAITSGAVLLEDGDTVTSSDATGINSSTAGSGVHVNGAVEIEVAHTGSESKGVYLDNGAQNNLGSGTSITVENINGTSSLTTVGVSVENKNNQGTGLVADQLNVTVINDKHVTGIVNSGSNSGAIDLGDKSTISVATTGNGMQVRGVDLSGNSVFKMNEGTITASGPGFTTGIYTSGTANVQLGDHTKISSISDSSSAHGIYFSSSAGNILDANALEIKVSGTMASGISGKGAIDLGEGGKIEIASIGYGAGIELNSGSTLKTDGLTIIGTVPSSGSAYGMRLDNTIANLGTGTSITMKGDTNTTGTGMGLYVSGSSSIVTADGLTVSTEKGYGLNIQNGASVNAGAGSVISSGGDYQDAIWAVGTGAKFEAQGVTLNASGASAQGITAQNGGTAKMGAGSHITSVKGGGLVASSNSSIDFIGGTTAATRNTITAGGSYGASAQQANTTVNLKNTDIKVDRNGATAYALWAVSSGVINAENVTIKAADGVYGIVSNGGGKTNLSGDIVIDASSDVAIITDSATSWTKGTGKMAIKGSLIAQNNGLIDLIMTAGSSLAGAVNSETGTGNLNMTGTAWEMTDDSSVTNLALANSTVTFNTALDKVADATTFGKLNVTNLSGTDGVFSLRTNLEDLQGDLVSITGTSSGNHGLFINNQAGATVDPTQELIVVETADGNANFALKNNVEAGGYQYGLKADGNNWALYSTGKATSTTDASVNIFSGGYLLNYAETQSLLQRMGDLRQSEDSSGVWARAYGGR